MKSSVSNKRLILTFLCFVLLTFMHAQSSNFTFSIEKRIGVSDRSFIEYGNVPDVLVDNFSRLEKPKLAYELGVLISQKISQRLYFQTGIRYVAWGHRTGKIPFRTASPSSPPDHLESTTWNLFLEVPVALKYYVPLNQNSFYAHLSYAPNYNLSNTVIRKLYYGERVERNTFEENTHGVEYQRLNMLGEIGLGWSVPLFGNTNISVGPVFRIQTFEQTEITALNRRLFFYGLSTAITFR